MLRQNTTLRSVLLLCGVGLSTLLWACSGVPDAAEDPETPVEQSFGIVAVKVAPEAAASPSGQTDGALAVNTTAQFVRYRALDKAQVGRLLALPVVGDADLPALDQCEIFQAKGGLTDHDMDYQEERYVDLLEAGEVQVETGGAATLALSPRHFPGLLPFISGVVYSEAEAVQVARPQRIEASAEGSESVGAFEVSAAVPEAPQVTQWPGIQRVGTGSLQTLRTQDVLRLRWTPTRTAEAQGDTTYLELRNKADSVQDESAEDGTQRVLRCVMEDDGAFDIRPDGLVALTGGGSGQVQLRLARLRRQPFVVRGIDHAELVLDNAVSRTLLLVD